MICTGKLFMIPKYTVPVVVALSSKQQVAQCLWQAQFYEYFTHDWGVLHYLNIIINCNNEKYSCALS